MRHQGIMGVILGTVSRASFLQAAVCLGGAAEG